MTVLPPMYKDGITAGRLDAETLSDNFCDVHPPLDPHEAQVAADRCYFCYDAPCIQACPTSIDIPLFIRQIATGTPEAAAKTIFDSNILGGMCARVCPTETLCEEACVRELAEQKPVEIGALQRYATDKLMARDRHPYTRAASTGKVVAVVGAGPAGLAAAHRLAMYGHAVTLFEARSKAGGLNEYGIAAYKTVDDFAQAELDWLLGIGGITVETGKALGEDLSLDSLSDDFDAVFLSIGLGGVNALGVDSEQSLPAVDFIEDLRQTEDLTKLAVGRRVVVIGGGMTAVDAAVQSKLLGAEEVTIVYRREQAKMAASEHEQNHASASGVRIITNAAPVGISGAGVEFAYTVSTENGLQTSDETFVLPADQVLTAIGQTLSQDQVEGLDIVRGKIAINDQGQTSRGGVWAGGDCASGGDDLTVTAVAQGRDAAEDIHASMMEGILIMADLKSNFVGIESPNPFWLASAPPTDKEYNVRRAFDAGWGGVVWKTLGIDPAIVNVNGPRYGAVWSADRRLMGLNNIELITDRPLQTNLDEIARVKRDYPSHAMVVSLMVPCEEHAWREILPQVEDTGADGIELNFGCPHGMSERGMGSAVGQVPEYVEMVTAWCKEFSRLPVIVKLTPNITDIKQPARAAMKGGADAVSLINTINSITSVNLDEFSPEPMIDGRGAHGGYCGPAVKPIAMNMVAEIARTPDLAQLPISGIGGVSTWRDAAEFMTLGAGNVQVCTAAMTYGFHIVQEMISGLSLWMDEKGMTDTAEIVGRAVPNLSDWQNLNLNYITKARIDEDLCIGCGRCFASCEDTSHQAIAMEVDETGKRVFTVKDDECVACNLCINVCPVDQCITMERLEVGAMDERTGKPVEAEFADWTTHPNNPAAQ